MKTRKIKKAEVLVPETQLKHVEYPVPLLEEVEAKRKQDKARGVVGVSTFTALSTTLLDKYRKGEISL